MSCSSPYKIQPERNFFRETRETFLPSPLSILLQILAGLGVQLEPQMPGHQCSCRGLTLLPGACARLVRDAEQSQVRQAVTHSCLLQCGRSWPGREDGGGVHGLNSQALARPAGSRHTTQPPRRWKSPSSIPRVPRWKFPDATEEGGLEERIEPSLELPCVQSSRGELPRCAVLGPTPELGLLMAPQNMHLSPAPLGIHM